MTVIIIKIKAGVAKLVDALVLGTSGVTRGGSSPSTRTILICKTLQNCIYVNQG